MIKLFSILLLGTLFLSSCGRLSDSIWARTGAPAAVARVGNLGPFTPGTFEGIGAGGYHGDIHVAVTFDEADIIALEVTYCNETPAFAAMTYDTLIPRVLQAQTYQVDIVVGATATSVGFLGAIQDAVRQAAGQ